MDGRRKRGRGRRAKGPERREKGREYNLDGKDETPSLYEEVEIKADRKKRR
jgi:hypothetical protein